jgi:hypothetical protein
MLLGELALHLGPLLAVLALARALASVSALELVHVDLLLAPCRDR